MRNVIIKDRGVDYTYNVKTYELIQRGPCRCFDIEAFIDVAKGV